MSPHAEAGIQHNYSVHGEHGLDSHDYGVHDPAREAMAEHNLDHYNVRKYEDHDPHAEHGYDRRAEHGYDSHRYASEYAYEGHRPHYRNEDGHEARMRYHTAVPAHEEHS